MSSLPHVTWLRAFEAAARNGSFSAAAEELGLTPAAVSQQIKLLEQHLGVTLFLRLPRGVALTDMGHAYAQPIRRSFSDMHEATRSLFGASGKRRVRLRVSISYAALVLAPQLGAFQQDFPGIDLEVTTAVWTDRIDDDAIDAEVRYGYGDWAEPDIRHLCHLSAQVVCAPQVARATRADLHRLAAQAVQIIGSETDWGRMAALAGVPPPVALGAMTVESSLIALQMLASGTGSAIVAETFARPYLADGRLVAPLDLQLPLPRSFFLVVPERAAQRPEVARFCDWLTDRHLRGLM